MSHHANLRQLSNEESIVVDERIDVDSTPFWRTNKLKLAPFGFNCNKGGAMSNVEGTPVASWQETIRIVTLAERAGLDAVIPVARWDGYGGEGNHEARSFEPLTWAAAVAAVTERISVFATVHLPTAHPVRLAKMIATIDHVSGGRFGLNVVAGWNDHESALFGATGLPHDKRYDFADEYMELLTELCNTDDYFDFAGEYFQVPHAYSDPHPVQRPLPVVMSAGVSPRGLAFAARHADISFALVDNLETARRISAEIRTQARSLWNRAPMVFSTASIFCADTEREAQALFDRVLDHGDVVAARRFIEVNAGTGTAAYDNEPLLRRVMACWGAMPLIGTPEQVVEHLADISAAGIDGLALTWANYEQGIATYDERLRALLVEAGLRTS
jgi:FMNH2-dependent dimethyl sulfone monooxygenase